MGRAELTCECGRRLVLEEAPDRGTITFFCENCYLNMVVERTGEGQRVVLRYYFPDD